MKQNSQLVILKRLLKLALNDRGLFILSLLGTIMQVGLTIYLPVLIGQAVDAVGSGGPNLVKSLIPILSKMAYLIVANSLIQWFNPLMYNRMIFRLIQTIRQDVLKQLHHLPLSVLDRMGIGDLVARVTTDTEQLSDGLLMIFNQFLIGILTIFVTIFSMGRIDPFMMCLVVCLTPLSLFVSRFIAKRSYQFYQAQTKARGDQAQLVEETVQQEVLIQLSNAQTQQTERYDRLNQKYTDYTMKATFYSSIINPSTRFINALIYALLTGLGAYRIIHGFFTVGQLTTFLNYANQYTKPFNDTSSVLSELQSAMACAGRLFDLIDQAAELETGQAQLAEDIAGKVAFDQVSFSYEPQQELITDLNLDMAAGSKIAIVGPTGAGKSTLINLLMRFYEVNEGHILIDGQPITAFTRDSLRQRMGMVLQETWLKQASIHDNIAYGKPQATRAEVVAAAKAANADFFIRQLPQGYDTILTDSGESLSQGQRQLLTIARIFVDVPQILILDEATSSIDTRTEALIQEAFDRLMVGRTSFVIAHRLSTIQSADHILVMVAGKIVEQGDHHSLMKQAGIYYQMQMSQGALN